MSERPGGGYPAERAGPARPDAKRQERETSVTLSELESKRLLAAHGMPFAPEAVADDPEAAVTAADRLGYPVAVKCSGAGIAHKTERGLVRLGLGGPDAVRVAAADLLRAAGPDDGVVALLVAPMLQGSRELIAGIHSDPQFGPCVMVGIGGVLAEAVADVAFRLLPIEPADAADMIGDLRAQPLLGPVRGEPPVDRDALAEVLLVLSRVAAARPDVVGVDVNPLIVVDGAPVAVDALVEVRG